MAESSCWNLAGCVAVTLLAVIYVYFKWKYQYWKRRNLPYIEPTFPFGSICNPFKGTIYVGEQFYKIYKEAKIKGWRHCGLYAMAEPLYFVVDLELVKQVTTKDYQFFNRRKMYVNEKDDWMSIHLFSMNGQQWKNIRPRLTTSFTTGRLKNISNIVIEHGLNFQKFLEKNVGTPLDAKDISVRYCMDTMAAYVFGADCDCFQNPNTPFRILGKKMFNFNKLEAMKLAFCLFFPSLGHALGLRLVTKPTTEFFYNVAKETVAYREKNKMVGSDLMQLLMDMRDKETPESLKKEDGSVITMEELAAQAFIFFSAGYEGTSSVLAHTMYMLGKHPDIQEKVREEVNVVFNKHGKKFNYDMISDLKYTQQVIDEVTRTFPPFAYLTRVCSEDYKVPGEDVIIEKGTGVIVPVTGIHYDEEFYEDPYKFDPDRFTKEKKRERNRYTHMPFGEGPRVCIGERLGLIQTKMGITAVLQKFRIKVHKKSNEPVKTIDNVPVEGNIFLEFEKL